MRTERREPLEAVLARAARGESTTRGLGPFFVLFNRGLTAIANSSARLRSKASKTHACVPWHAFPGIGGRLSETTSC